MAVTRFLKKAKEIQENAEARVRESKKKSGGHDESNWLVSYADMMTLLCMFFVMMFTMSEPKKPELEEVKKQIADAFGGKYESPTEDLKRYLTQLIEENGLERDAVVLADPSGVSVVFQSKVFFDTLGAGIRPTGRSALDKLIAAVKLEEEKEKKNYKVVIEGHTDGRPITAGSFPSNWELSAARATTVVRRFLEAGFAPSQIIAIGYGSTRPLYLERDPNGRWDEEALSKNRRVVVRILEPDNRTIPWNSYAEPSRLPSAESAETPPSPTQDPSVIPE